MTGGKWYVYRASAEQARLRSDLPAAEVAWLAALEEAEDYGQHSPRLTTTLEGLSEVYWLQGKFDQAAPICRRLLRIYESTLGREHLDVGIISNNLAMLYHSWQKYEEAEGYYKRSLEIKRKSMGPDHPDVVSCLSNYAALLHKTNRSAEAEKLQAAAEEVSEDGWKKSGNWSVFK
ncbi:MAG TPA: tetratricopeptide repeat protein [Planktothrix sp.]|jgi:tetratricopeptide (TPR) repeat protein